MLKRASPSGNGARAARAPGIAAAVRAGRPARAAAAIALVQSTSLPTLVQSELERMILAGDLRAAAS